MQELRKDELMNVNGGAVTIAGGLLIVAGVVFVVGIVDGYLRPLRCN